jgi:FixJ family two-component response regulator
VSKGPLIGVVDDDVSFRIALAESLRSLGYEAIEFASGDEFLAQGGEGACDCVISDIHMPGISGFDLKRMLVARGVNLPVIMITARGEKDLDAKAASSDAVCLLRKPFETDLLVGCIAKALKA